MEKVPWTGQEEHIEGKKSQLSTEDAWRQIATKAINCLSDREGEEQSLG